MSEILILVGLILGFAITLFTLNKRRIREQQTDTLKCLDSLLSLKDILILIQQHRGLSTGALNGKKDLNQTIAQVTIKIDKTWSELKQRFPSLAQQQLFEGVSSHWSRLKTRWKSQSVSNNIQQHNRLITNLLYLIENQAESNANLTKFARHSGLDIVWKELLETIEAIGQARAIGMCIAGKGQSTTVERIQIQFLLDKVDTRLDRLIEVFINTIKTDWSIDYTNEAKQRAIVLSEFIEAELLNKPAITEKQDASEAFFKLASGTISPLDKLFGEAVKEIRKTFLVI